jgi:sugar phosphate isomerase/epimerase
MPRISCSTGSLYHLPLALALRILRDAGFAGAEIVASPETLARGQRETTRIIRQSGLPALSLHPPLYPLPGWPRTQLGRALATMEHAIAFGSEIAVIHAPKSKVMTTPRARQYIAAITATRNLGARHGVAIGLETTQKPWKIGQLPLLFDHLDYFMDFVAAHDLGVTYDISHAIANGDDPAADLTLIGAHMRNIHFSDCGPITPGQKPPTHLRPGYGATGDLAAFTRVLAHHAYTGIITLEISPLALRPWSLPTIIRRLIEARQFVTQAFVAEKREHEGRAGAMAQHVGL